MLEKTDDPTVEGVPLRRVAWALLPFLLGCYIVAMIDRLNVGYAKLQFLVCSCGYRRCCETPGCAISARLAARPRSSLSPARSGWRPPTGAPTATGSGGGISRSAPPPLRARSSCCRSAHSVPVTTLCLALAVVGLFGFLALFWTMLTAVLGSGVRAGGLALVSAVGAMGSVVSPPVVGWVQVLTGSLYGAITVLAVLFLFSVLALHACIPARTAGAVAC